jgi:hypothetical protein
MKNIHSFIAILLLSILIAEIPVIAESQLTTPSPSPKPSPSPPEFTARFAASSLEVTIKNQPLVDYVDTNDGNPSLYFGFRFKDHENIQDWNYAPLYYVGISSYGTYYKASVSDYTVVSFPLGSYPLIGILDSGQVDLQVIALIGNEVPTNYEKGSVYGFDGVTSVWSDVQTITILVSSTSPIATLTTSIQDWVAAVILVVVLAVTAVLLVYFMKHKHLRKFTSYEGHQKGLTGDLHFKKCCSRSSVEIT